MRVAHFDCFSGLSGDMVLGAVVDAGVPADALRAVFAPLGLPITLEAERVKRNGIAATKVTVVAPDEEDYRYLPDVEAIIGRAAMTDRQRDLARTIFRKLAVAEAAVHGMPVEKVHFHEVGALDSIADILGAAVGLDLLGVDRFTSRPVPPGSGSVKCAHGLMPVPAPATAELLKGIPLAASVVKGELTTPTGAAILATVVTEFVDTPAMTIDRIGCGAGTRDPIEQPNILRLFVGEAHERSAVGSGETDTIWVLETNLDDCPGEVVGYTSEALFAAGALDVFAVPIQMKKNRPGVLLTVLADDGHRGPLEAILFRETGTFGVRRQRAERSKLRREPGTVETAWGPVQVKRGTSADGRAVVTPEYESCARVARERGVALRDVYAAIQRVTG